MIRAINARYQREKEVLEEGRNTPKDAKSVSDMSEQELMRQLNTKVL